LTLGISNVSAITYNNGLGQMIMDGPGTNLTATIKVLADNVALGSTIDGSMGAVTHIGGNVIPASPGDFSGAVGNNTITVGPGGDGVFLTGASTVTELAHGFGNVIYIGGYANTNATHASITAINPDVVAGGTTNIVFQEITDGADAAYQGFWGLANGAAPTAISGAGGIFGLASNGGTSASMSVDTGFTAGVGSAFDTLTFLTDAWSGGVAGSIGSLYFDDGVTTLHNTVNSLAGTATSAVVIPNAAIPQITAANNFLVDNAVGTIANAATLALDINTLDPFTLAGAGIAAGAHAHILVAYASSANGGGTTIADLDIVNTTAAAQNTTNVAGVHIFASDMVELVGITTAQIATANIHFA
jgi:hypothetical protein